MLFVVKIFYLIVFFAILFFPSFVAGMRNHNNFTPILLVNLILSFTIIGYIVALIWSFSDNTKKEKQKIKNANLLLIFTGLILTNILFSSFFLESMTTEMQKNIFIFHSI